MNDDKLKESYNRVAPEYTRRIAGELEHKPFDRDLLNQFAAQLKGKGVVADVGCGPGHVAGYLYQQGIEVIGLDLSEEMVKQAASLNPAIFFRQGDMLSLPVPDQSWAGIVAFYSIIHIPRAKVVSVLQEFKRVLQPGGLLLLAFHRGQEIRHFDELWGAQVSLDFIFFERLEMEGYLQSTGFDLLNTYERAPYPEVEAQTERVYILACKPDK
jgi:ubiquinone/menaquinone biosynthesis C-methylase UbiE